MPETCWVPLRLRWGGRHAGDWIPECCPNPVVPGTYACAEHQPDQFDGDAP